MDNQILGILKQINTNLERIADALNNTEETGPRYRAALADYPKFNWDSINAQVVAQDRNGATIVRWRNYEWKRHSRPSYGPDVWFSRCVGKDDRGQNKFARLITFSQPDDSEIEPLSHKITRQLPTSPRKPQQRTRPAPAPASPDPAPVDDANAVEALFPRPKGGAVPWPQSAEEARQRFNKLAAQAAADERIEFRDLTPLAQSANKTGWVKAYAELCARVGVQLTREEAA